MRRPTRITMKDNQLEADLFRRRALVSAFFVLAMFVVLLVRYYVLQVSQYETYATLSENNRVHLEAISPPRGFIYDRKGRLLADNRPSFSLTIDGEQLTDVSTVATMLGELTPVLHLSPEELRQFWGSIQPRRILTVRQHLSDDDIVRFKAVSSHFPGVSIVEEETRAGKSHNLVVARGTPDRAASEAQIAALTPVLGLTPGEIKQFWNSWNIIALAHKSDKFPLRLHLSEDDIARFSEVRYRYPAVDIDVELARRYPYGDLFAHAIGYVSRISEKEQADLDATEYEGTNLIGKIGIEKFYEPWLHGKVGYQHVETNAHGRLIRVLAKTPPVRGDDLTLFLDYDLQRIAVEQLNGRRGAVVAIDPATGGVLAFVSTPSFDPNLFVDGISFPAYQSLSNNIDHPLNNRALQGTYPAGSTVKPFEGMGGLHYGLVDWDYKISDNGTFHLQGDTHIFRDWKKGGHGIVALHEAVEESCDIYFYTLADRMGIDKLHDWMVQFGFGARTGVDLVSEASGIYPSTAWKRQRLKAPWYRGETPSVGIGQGYVTVTPLQLAMATAIMANNGKHIRPHLLKSVTGPKPYDPGNHPDGQVQYNGSPDDWNKMHEAMKAVVHGPQGTAKSLARGIQGYEIAGKTGTAQVAGIKQGEKYDASKLDPRHLDHAWFIGFAPADKPKIAVAVLVENGGHGGSAAGPIARAMFDYEINGIVPPPPPPLQANAPGAMSVQPADGAVPND
jgi:penicillin-binding protein 2